MSPGLIYRYNAPHDLFQCLLFSLPYRTYPPPQLLSNQVAVIHRRRNPSKKARNHRNPLVLEKFGSKSTLEWTNFSTYFTIHQKLANLAFSISVQFSSAQIVTLVHPPPQPMTDRSTEPLQKVSQRPIYTVLSVYDEEFRLWNQYEED